jgi:hypothetical protein
MLTGAHAILYSTDADADRRFLRDILKLPSVDVGDGWLIFGLPPAEVAVHPSGSNDRHELYLMVDDIEAFVAAMAQQGVQCDAVTNLGWGRLGSIHLPGGGKLGVYQPRHARPKPMTVGKPKKKAARKKAAKPKRPAKTKKPAPKKAKPRR